MELPKINLKRKESRKRINVLESEILEILNKHVLENNISTIEINSVLLNILKYNNDSDLNQKFGYLTE